MSLAMHSVHSDVPSERLQFKLRAELQMHKCSKHVRTKGWLSVVPSTASKSKGARGKGMDARGRLERRARGSTAHFGT